MTWDSNSVILVFLITVLIITIIYQFTERSDDEEVVTYQADPDAIEKAEEKQSEIYNQRVQLVINSVNVLWNSLAIDKWFECDQTKAEESVMTNSVIFSDDVVCVYSTYIPRSLKITCQLSWAKQKMYVRVEQQMEIGVIEVEREIKVKAGIISVMQSEDIAEEYFNSIMELTNSAQKDETEVKSEN